MASAPSYGLSGNAADDITLTATTLTDFAVWNGDLTLNHDLNLDGAVLGVTGKLTMTGGATLRGRGSVIVTGDVQLDNVRVVQTPAVVQGRRGIPITQVLGAGSPYEHDGTRANLTQQLIELMSNDKTNRVDNSGTPVYYNSFTGLQTYLEGLAGQGTGGDYFDFNLNRLMTPGEDSRILLMREL